MADDIEQARVLTDKGARGVRKTLKKVRGGVKKVPGPSTNPATNLIIADVVLRGAAAVARQAVEKGLLRARYDKEHAKRIVQGKTLGHTLASYAIAKTATRSLPGFLLVTGGLLGKAVLDRSLSKGKAERRGDETLENVADNTRD